MINSTSQFTEDTEGNVTQIVTTNDEATITSVFNRTNGEITSIVATVVPIEGDVQYTRTTTFANNTITTQYAESPKP